MEAVLRGVLQFEVFGAEVKLDHELWNSQSPWSLQRKEKGTYLLNQPNVHPSPLQQQVPVLVERDTGPNKNRRRKALRVNATPSRHENNSKVSVE